MKIWFWVFLSTISAFVGTKGWAEPQKDFVILDVRTPEEYNETHVSGAKNIDFKNSNFKAEIAKLDKTGSYKLYCRTGNRSGQALEIMKGMGFSQLENLGSVIDASKKLKIACEGEKPCL